MTKKSNTTEFNQKASIVHNNFYDYSLVDYKKSKLKVIIICPIHGIFEQRPNDHLGGQGCPDCGGTNRLSIEKIKEKANIIHKNTYDYSLFTGYTSQQDRIEIICLTHGIFIQKINNHLNGRKCKYCAKNVKKTEKQFEDGANIIHNNLYDYSLSDYVDAKTEVIIICKKHGEFSQSPNSHLSGHGCPVCNESRGEVYVSKILDKYNIKYIREHKLYHEKYAPTYSLKGDFYLPELNIIIEYNGIQHYKALKFFGGEKGLEKNKKRDKIKELICEDSNIRLIKISYKYNTYKKIEEKLKNILFL
jgi:hypothetical protein